MTSSRPSAWIRLTSQLGLASREQWAWALYDWGNSAFATTIIAVLLPIYFFDVAAKILPINLRTAYWGYGSAAAMLVVALLSPFLGAVADIYGKKKLFLAGFTVLGCVGSAILCFVGEGDWLLALTAYILASIGFSASMIFYDSLLPHITKSGDEANRVSVAGYALGYLGGGLLLALNLAWILKPEFWGFVSKSAAVRASFLSVAVWWFLFSIPVLWFVPEPPSTGPVTTSWRGASISAVKRLRVTFTAIRNHRRVLMFLIAFWIYSDGIGTIIRMATTYGREIGIDQSNLTLAMLLVQILGLPLTLIYGPIASKFSPKRALLGSLAVYAGICVLGYFMTTAWHFWLLAIMIAAVQGGSQALSRSIYSGMIPKESSSEFFAFFSVSSKFAGVMGPMIFGVIAQASGNGRASILFLIAFFVVGGVLVAQTDLTAIQE
jgi:MFS transporter, UMF1 family